MVFIKRKIDNKLGRGVAGEGGERSRGGPEGGVLPWGRAASRPAGRSSPGGEEGVRRGGGRTGGRSSTCGDKRSKWQPRVLPRRYPRDFARQFAPHGRLGAPSRGKTPRPRPRPPIFPWPARASAYVPPRALPRRFGAA
jgi:hypothetical protein